MARDAESQHEPLIWSPRKLRRRMNRFPPLFFQRVKLVEVAADMRSCSVVLKRSRWNRNLNGSTFGGAIYSAGDLWFATLYWQALAREGMALQGWLKSCHVDYQKPARSDLRLEFRITDEDLELARDRLLRFGSSVHRNRVDAVDAEGEVCATLECTSFLRLLNGAAFTPPATESQTPPRRDREPD